MRDVGEVNHFGQERRRNQKGEDGKGSSSKVKNRRVIKEE